MNELDQKLYQTLAGLVDEIDCLISESDGVAGYYIHGEIAKWEDLEKGGQCECLEYLSIARELIKSI